MRRLTVVQLLPALHSGGVERSTLEVAQALVAAGHRAIVVSAGGRLVPPLLDSGAEHLALDIGRKSLLTLRHVVALRRLFAETGADIVHARSRLPAWLGWHALRGLPRERRPHWVTTMHGLNSPGRYSAIMATGERVICVSNTVRDYLLAHYPATDPQRLRVIPRGVDPAQFPQVAASDRRPRQAVDALYPSLAGDGPLLLLPGRGTRLKGHAIRRGRHHRADPPDRAGLCGQRPGVAAVGQARGIRPHRARSAGGRPPGAGLGPRRGRRTARRTAAQRGGAAG